jgi:ribosome recycling factor
MNEIKPILVTVTPLFELTEEERNTLHKAVRKVANETMEQVVLARRAALEAVQHAAKREAEEAA